MKKLLIICILIISIIFISGCISEKPESVFEKENALPEEEWNRLFGGNSADYADSVQQTLDGGYIVAGETFENALLIKTDANGIEQWNKTFIGSGGYVVGGYNGIRLIKTDVNGIEQWNRTFGGLASSVKQTSDDGYIVAGSSIMLVGAGLIKLDANGNEQWNMTFGKRSDKINSVQMTSDGGYILAGNNYSNRLSDAWLIKVSREPTEFERKRR